MKKDYLNPKELGAAPKFYSHAVSVGGQGRLIYVSGQVSWGPDGKVVGAGDMRAQCKQVFDNLTTVLKAAGATWGDIIKFNGYMVGVTPENVAAYRDVRQSYLKAPMPASTLVGVTALVQPELMLEVECVAAVGGGGVAKKPAAKKAKKKR